jgi:predicted glycosyltransferase
LIKNKIIFISPLDWGLGHATRCVPLIKRLMQDNVVVLGITKTTALIFNEEFPTLKKMDIEPYNISYSKKIPLSIKLLFDAPRILGVIKKEKQQLQQIIKEHKIEVVISDNRFGLSNKNVECIYMTHQLNIQAGVFSFIANQIHRHYIKQFNSVWIPDFEDEKNCLAGKLSRNASLKNVTYLGSLSRLQKVCETKVEYDYLCLLSGPEPLRAELEIILIEKAIQSDKKICIVRGTNLEQKSFVNKNVTIVDLPSAKELSQFICNSKTVVCRSGYSTLMDLHQLQNTNCILIPTPAQHEQVYLANYWEQKFGAKVINQKDLASFSLFN